MKNIIKYFKDRKANKVAEQKRLDYISERVKETGLEHYKNKDKKKENTNSKQYFFDSDMYEKIFS